MYDPKFEKAIQQKMEELEFRPPESVWVNIEKAVVDKRRRKTAFLWRYLLPAVLAVAAAGVYWHNAYAPVQPAAGKAILPVAGGSLQAGGGASGGPAAGGGAGSSLAAGSGESSSPANGSAAGPDASKGIVAQAGHSATDLSGVSAAFSRPAGRHRVAMHKESGGIGGAALNKTAEESGGTFNKTAEESGDETFNKTADGTVDETAVGGGAILAGQPRAADQKGLDAWFYLPGLADQRLTPQIHASALNTKKSNSVAMAGLSHPRRQWEAGFVAGGGLSRLNHLNSDQARSALASGTASFYTISTASSGSHYISDVRPEASFEGGIYLQRALSDRWIFNTGMKLHYYSNRITVGQPVTTYVQSAYSYLAPTALAAATQSMYSAGDTRSVINKYYFLEIPVGLQWKINKSHLLPIFVEGGVSLSRLMGASALFYNAKTGLYSKDGDIVNKTQFNIESALLVGLPFHGINIQVGPQIQYGLTPLVNTQGVGDQHLLYTGIRLVVIPGRK